MGRFKEGSTWAGFAAIMLALKFVAPQYALLIDAMAAASGGVAVMLRDRAKTGG